MQPIKTTNAMNPAPAKGIESFPTPVIDDVVISEIVNSWKGDYQPLEYGVMWKDVSHAPNQGSFPEHKLVFQQPTSEDGQWVKRIWVNDRVNQDSYNYAIKYSAGSQEHPIYIRTYIVPRETYAPLLDGTPDPLFPGALLVDEEAVRNEGELDSKYITVTRVYETLPGPAVPTRRYNERGDLETVIVQTVPPNTQPTTDGLLVTQSQVEQVETGKGVKTTATVQDHALLQIKEKKEGLLGETITTDDIVDPSTNPDALSQTIVASTVEQYTATKARKRTTTASGPTSLSQKSNDGKLLGDITSTQSVVEQNANPDAVSSYILSSDVRQVDSGKAIKTNVILNSTPTLSGKQNEQGLLGVKSTSESIVLNGASADPLSLSVISSVVEPIDSVRSRKITVTSSGPSSLSGGQKKEGLLGETNVNESIVSAGASPDSLSQTVVSSVVEPIDSAKSRKVTITATGPNSLKESSKDGKLLGDITSTESIVAPNTIPDAPSATILSSQVKQLDSGKAVKTNIVLNSTPTLIGGQAGEGLLGIRDTTETIVPSGTIPDEVSLTVISSQVEPIDSVRSRKITIESTGPTSLSSAQKKEGLLGETNIEESIVSAGAQPDALSETIVSSIIEPIDSAKSKKITITSTGPSSLEQRNKDGKLLGDITSVKSVVGPNDLPDNPDASILSSEVNQIDSGKAIKTNVVLNSTPTLSGKQSEQGLLGVKSTVESIVPAGTPEDPLSLSVISSSVEPIDSVRSRKVTITSTGPTSLAESTKDGKLLGDVISTESIVAPDTIPDAPSSTILSSQVKQLDSGKAVKTNVVLNSIPTLSGGQSGEGLLGTKDTVETIVAAGTSPDAVSLTVISSSVEPIDSVRSRKITVNSTGPTSLSGGQNKEGLLGETSVDESIVATGSSPDALSQTVISSVVEPIDTAKSRKVTITSNGPFSLSQKSNDGKLLGDTITTESVVSLNQNPDSVSSTILSSEVRQVDSGKAILRNVVLNSTPTLSGNQNEQGLLGIKSTTESIVAAGASADPLSVSVISSVVEPIDSVRSRKVTVESSGPSLLSGGQNKEGLLGETLVEELIVTAGTLPDALSSSVVSSVVEPIDSAKSKKVTITSTGPTSLTQKSNDGKLLGDIISTESVVASNTSPDAVSNTILSSEVKQIDSGKAIKRNVELNSTPILSGNQSGEGLLGTRNTVEMIVSAGTLSDPVSLTVLSSQVEPIDSVRSRKVTVTSTGPTSLNTNSLVDSPLGLVEANIKKSIVNTGSQTSNNNLTIVKDSIKILDEAKSEREEINVVGWPTNTGVDYDEQLGIGVFYTETIIPPDNYKDKDWGDVSNQNIKPLDEFKSIKKEIDKGKVSKALLSQWYKIETDIQVSLPDKLLDIIVYWGSGYGDGGDYDFGAGAFTGSYNRNQSGATKSSYSVNGDVYFNLQKGFNGSIPGCEHIFFMEIGSDGLISQGGVLDKLNSLASSNGNTSTTYTRWPYLQLRSENIILISGSESITTSNSLSESVSINGFSRSEGKGKSHDITINANSINIPECLHGSIQIKNILFGQSTPANFGVGNRTVPTTLNETSAIINGSPVSAPQFPVGNYLLNSNVELYKWGFVKVTAKTVNITSDYV